MRYQICCPKVQCHGLHEGTACCKHQLEQCRLSSCLASAVLAFAYKCGVDVKFLFGRRSLPSPSLRCLAPWCRPRPQRTSPGTRRSPSPPGRPRHGHLARSPPAQSRFFRAQPSAVAHAGRLSSVYHLWHVASSILTRAGRAALGAAVCLDRRVSVCGVDRGRPFGSAGRANAARREHGSQPGLDAGALAPDRILLHALITHSSQQKP